MEGLATLDYALVGVYLLAMIGIGWAVSSRIRGFRDYFLAGGTLTTPLLVCTLVSTYYELDVTFATSESGYYYGLAAWFWLSRPYYVVIIVAALILSTRLRSGQSGAMTLPDVLERHYGLTTRVLGAVACFVYSLPITALAGMNLLFTSLGWSPLAGLTVSVGICIVYTIMGGLWADAITDTVQFALMCVSLAVAIPFALEWVGGWGFVEHLPEGHMTATGGLSPFLIAAWTAGALTVFVEPAFYQRIFAAKSAAAVRRSLLIGILLWAAYDWGVTLIGMIARSAAEQGIVGAALDGGAAGEGALVGKEALLTICMISLPIGLKGLFLGGILAAAMSSVDSYSLLASGNIVYDIIRPIRERIGRAMSDRQLVLMTRAGVFVVMFFGVGASLLFERITDAWTFMAGVLVSVVFVPVAATLVPGLWTPRRAAGVASAGAGLVTLVAFHVMVHSAGVYDEEAESWVWLIGEFPVYREYASIAALPASLAGLLIGHVASRREELRA